MKTIIRNESHVTVTREVGEYAEHLFNDGDSVDIKKYQDVVKVALVKDGKTLVETDFIQRKVNPDGSVARMGWSKVYVSQATLDIIDRLIAEVKAEAVDESEKPAQKPEEKWIVNPAYANLTTAELDQKRRDYDNVQNEGTTEGFNPYRDNYLVLAGE
jgi:hypothetical protein